MEKYHGSGTNLTSLSREDVVTWLKSFDCCLTDCDGVLWIYTNTIPGSPEVINKFTALGKRVFFITNNSTKTREEFLEKATKMNYNVNAENILSTAFLVAQYLKNLNFQKKVFIVGSTGIARELDAAGIKHTDVGPDVLETNLADLVQKGFTPDPEVGAVVVGFDEHFSFPKMFKAASYLSNPDVLFIATNTDERFPMPGFVVPGTGSIVRSIETCGERKALVMGKPSPYACEYILKTYGIDPKRTLMVGDRCNTDILLGKRCGFQTLMVESGIHSRKDLEEWKKSDDPETKELIPDFYVDCLGSLETYLSDL
ncbi:glycerol-3-phosphate phosphatase [Culicoides brevitarsis]|uniref:glycerol-3-phosphate phosphatase n=1 Tax=Culicoides brevitarsis TaxID=469753 RepID=UPI00307C1C45